MEGEKNERNDFSTSKGAGSSILSLLPQGFKYTNFVYNSVGASNVSVIKFQCNVLDTEGKIRHWAKQFGERSYVVWRISKTSPKLKQIKCMCKVEYRCQFANSWYHAKSGSPRKSKSMHCPATMLIKCSPRFIGEEKTITEIILKNEHNHSIGKAASTLTYRDVSEQTQDTLRKLYSNGHMPQSAYQTLQGDAFIKYGSRVLNDRNYVPDMQYCYNFFYKEFKNRLGSVRDATKTINFFETSNRLAMWSSKTGGYAKIIQTESLTADLKVTICIVTPLMLRVHQTISQSAKVVFIDHTHKSEFGIFFLSTDSPVGNLPLGYIITTDSGSTSIALQVFMSLDRKGEFFYGRSKRGPENVFAENDLIQSLINFWPESRPYFTPFDMVKTVWDWLKTNEIDSREEILLKFKEIYTQDPKIYLEEHPNFVAKYSSFCNSLNTWLPDSQYWSVPHFKHLLIPKEQKNIYVEYGLRSVRDMFIKNIKNYQVNQLIDFILTRFDKYYAQRLQDFIDAKFQITEVRNFLPSISKKHFTLEAVNELSDELYIISTHDESDFFIDFQLGFCNCNELAQKGIVCEHQVLVAVYKTQNIPDLSMVYSGEIYESLSYICHGKKCIKLEKNNAEEDENEDMEENSDMMEQGHGAHKHVLEKSRVVEDSESIDSSSVYMEATYTDTETEDDSKEVIIIEVEPEQTVENCTTENSDYVVNLEDVLNEIILRVEDCQDQEMLEVMEKFCENYRLFCDNDEDLKIALSNFCKLASKN